MIALWWSLAWACDAPIPSAEVANALAAAADRFAAADVEGYQTRARAALDDVACVRDPLEPALVAELHRAAGLLAFVDRQTDRATTAFAAARGIEPGYVFPTSILPEQHPIREQYEAVDPGAGKTRAVGEPVGGRLNFDGTRSLQRPAERPTLFQRFEASGAVVDTAYLWPEDPLPDYKAKRPPSPLVRPLWIGAGSGLAASAALLGGAALSRQAFDNLALDTQEGQDGLEPGQQRTNGLLVASAGVSVLGLGSGVGALALTRW